MQHVFLNATRAQEPQVLAPTQDVVQLTAAITPSIVDWFHVLRNSLIVHDTDTPTSELAGRPQPDATTGTLRGARRRESTSVPHRCSADQACAVPPAAGDPRPRRPRRRRRSCCHIVDLLAIHARHDLEDHFDVIIEHLLSGIR